jgi:hypothetical protein
MARERLATRTYTESEALNLAVRNLFQIGVPRFVAWWNAINRVDQWVSCHSS